MHGSFRWNRYRDSYPWPYPSINLRSDPAASSIEVDTAVVSPRLWRAHHRTTFHSTYGWRSWDFAGDIYFTFLWFHRTSKTASLHPPCFFARVSASSVTAFSSLPTYHKHGLAAPFMNWNKRKITYLWDNTVPQTRESLTIALQFSQPEIVYTMPYHFKLLAETQRGINLLKTCRIVSFLGSLCPDELDDR